MILAEFLAEALAEGLGALLGRVRRHAPWALVLGALGAWAALPAMERLAMAAPRDDLAVALGLGWPALALGLTLAGATALLRRDRPEARN